MTYEVDCRRDGRPCIIQDDPDGNPTCRHAVARLEDGLPPMTHKENAYCQDRLRPRDR